jgi:hypothetical protein
MNLGISQGSGELITSSTTFWYMPWWAILIVVLVLGAIAFGGYLLYKRFSVPKTKHGVKK